MKTLIIFFILLLTAGCCTSGVGQNSFDRAADCPWQLAGSGTSFPIHCTFDREVKAWRTTFLTAGHVAAAIVEPLSTSHRDGRTLVDGVILAKHPDKDAALVQFLSPRKVWPVEMDFEPLRYGERVLVPGYQGMGGLPWIVEGFASGPDRCSTPMYGGGSGGPVLDRSGASRAIVVSIRVYASRYGGYQVAMHHCHVLPLSEIEDWICSELK